MSNSLSMYLKKKIWETWKFHATSMCYLYLKMTITSWIQIWDVYKIFFYQRRYSKSLTALDWLFCVCELIIKVWFVYVILYHCMCMCVCLCAYLCFYSSPSLSPTLSLSPISVCVCVGVCIPEVYRSKTRYFDTYQFLLCLPIVTVFEIVK